MTRLAALGSFVRELVRRARRDQVVADTAAGLAFRAMLALFPALIVVVAAFGWFADPTDVDDLARQLDGVVPADVISVVTRALRDLLAARQGAGVLGLVGVAIAAWSATSGMLALIRGLNRVDGLAETRGFVRLRLVGLGLTIGMLMTGVLLVVLVVAGAPASAFAAEIFGSSGVLQTVLWCVQWLLALAVGVGCLWVVYRYGPCERDARAPALPGAMAATAVWLVASGLFSVYVALFASYNRTYGALGAAAILVTWLNVCAAAVLVGAIVNAMVADDRAADHARASHDVWPSGGIGNTSASPTNTGGPAR
jgi:membrane protein